MPVCISFEVEMVDAHRHNFFYRVLAEGLFQEQEFKKSSIVYAEICMCVCILGILVS